MRIFTLSIPSFGCQPFSELTPDNQEVNNRERRKNPSCARFVYCLACSCRRTEAEASEVDISEAKLSWVAGERERREKREIVMYIRRTHSQRRLFLLLRRYLSFYIKEEEKLRSLRTSTERRMENLLFALSPEWNEYKLNVPDKIHVRRCSCGGFEDFMTSLESEEGGSVR